MFTKKAKVQHFLANIFTVLDFELNDTELLSEKKQSISDLLKVASLVVAHEDLILGQEIKFFKQDIDIQDIIETTFVILEDKITQQNIGFKSFKANMIVQLDRIYFGKAFTLLMQNLVANSQQISLKYDRQKHQLQILCNTRNLSALDNDQTLVDLLHKDSIYNDELAYNLALKIFQLHGNKPMVSDDQIILSL